MKKLLYLFIPAAVLLLLYSCMNFGKIPVINEPAAAKYIDKTTSRPLQKLTQFKQSDPVIYFTVRIWDLPKKTTLKAVWKYLEDGTEVSSEITTGGSGYEAFSLKKNEGLFPAGKYEVTVSAVVKGEKLEVKGSFEILAEAEPTHLLNPVTSKGIDSEDTLNPDNVTSEFGQGDPVIYFIIQTKDLPAGTKVQCDWLYEDTGEVITNDITAEGNRNIAFNLTPDPEQKLPLGKYIVTASININNVVESVSKEFEIK